MRTLCIALLVLCAGCFPATRVTKNPCDKDKGIRYYRPKPYLLIKPHAEKDNKNPSAKFVDIQLQMLPDFTEEYSIHIRPGLGSNDTKITLDQGWNLTQVNVNIDSKFDDNVKAITEGISKFVPSKSDGAPPAMDGPTTVQATNVPIGYYEAVISRGDDGKKRMYGWRYIGFSPYAYCPQESCGVECQGDCEHRQLFGIVFENGTMTFKELNQTRFASHAPNELAIQKALKQFENQVARAVPAILSSLAINDVSAKNIDVTTDRSTQTIDVNAVLDATQIKAYQAADATDYEISEMIAKTIEADTGQDILFSFRVTPRN